MYVILYFGSANDNEMPNWVQSSLMTGNPGIEIRDSEIGDFPLEGGG